MKRSLLTLAPVLAVLAASPALAGDAEAGAKVFNKCKACHSIVDASGTAIVKGGKTGPNLYGVIGRAVASYPDFKYGDGILAYAATGAVWDEASLAEYVKDPSAFLTAKMNGTPEKSMMTLKLKEGGEDVAAYLATMKPAQ